MLNGPARIDAELKPLLVRLVDRVAVMMPGDVRRQRLNASFHEYLYAGLRAELLALGHQSREALQTRLEALQPEERVDTMAAMAEMTLRRPTLSHGAMDPIAGELAMAALNEASRLPASPALSAAVLRAHSVVGLGALQAGDRPAAVEHLKRASAVTPAGSLTATAVFYAYDQMWCPLLEAGERESVAVALEEVGSKSRSAGGSKGYEQYAHDIRAGQMPAVCQAYSWFALRQRAAMARVERDKQKSAMRQRAYSGG